MVILHGSQASEEERRSVLHVMFVRHVGGVVFVTYDEVAVTMTRYRWHPIKVGLLIWAGRRFDTCALYFETVYILAQKRHAAKEHFMVIARCIGTTGNARKPVKIQLSLKRRDFRLSEKSTMISEEDMRRVVFRSWS